MTRYCFLGLLLALLPLQAGADPLVGIWGSERVLGPQVRGELTLVRTGSNWSARISGFDIPARVEGRKVSVVFGWVERSVAKQATMPDGRTYGYTWWRHELRVGDRVYSQYEASGNGGQLVMVVPELDLVVLFTAGNYNHVALWRKFREELLPQYILAAASAPPRP